MLGQAVGRDQETMATDSYDDYWRSGSGRVFEGDYMIKQTTS